MSDPREALASEVDLSLEVAFTLVVLAEIQEGVDRGFLERSGGIELTADGLAVGQALRERGFTLASEERRQVLLFLCPSVVDDYMQALLEKMAAEK